jgi:capsular polysaccharide biosynthesis protein
VIIFTVRSFKKRSEADIVKAANLSDVHFIDPAKDVGGGLIGPKTSVNYILALFLGILIPLLLYLLFSLSITLFKMQRMSVK